MARARFKEEWFEVVRVTGPPWAYDLRSDDGQCSHQEVPEWMLMKYAVKYGIAETVKVDGRGMYGVQRRYFRRSTGEVLYDLREWGGKTGHHEEELYAVPEHRIMHGITSMKRV